MNVVIFGATGRTGNELAKQSLAAGHTVTVFVREPRRLKLEAKNITIITGDVLSPASIAGAVKGRDAVLIALGTGNSLRKTTVRSTGTANIILAMKAHNVKRLAVISAMGIGESWRTLSLSNRFFFATLLRSARNDHTTQETVVKNSGLDWTIIRPSGLVDTRRTGSYMVGENIEAKKSRIACADVADLIVKELSENRYIHKAVTITN